MRSLALLLAFLLTSALHAQGTPFRQVVPAANADTEGPSSAALPFGSSLARHVLYAYDGSTVGYLAPARIAAIELRCDGATPGTSVAGTYNFTLSVSTGRNPTTALDPTFANNHGSDRITVFTGTRAIAAPPVGSAPNAFSLRIPFNAIPAFEWDPRLGPLVLDFVYLASTPAFGAWDAASVGVGGLSANTASATLATGVLTTAPVLRLDLAGDVTPAAFANTAGTASTGFPWNQTASTAMRTLNLYEGSSMPFTGRRRITALGWRTASGAAYAARSYDVRITLSTTPLTASTLGTTFANAIGADAVVVFDGILVAGPSPASADLTQFDLFCELQRSFEYDPALGSLSVDFQLRSSTGPTGASFDCTNQAGLGDARITNTTSATAATSNQSVQPGIAMVMAMRTLPVPTAPQSLANVTNTTANSTNFPFGTTTCRSLQMISAADAGITQPTFVRHLRFRPSTVTTFGPSTFTCTIDLSNPANTPATVSATFDSNHGSNRVRVFDGQFSVPFGTRAANDPGFPIEVKLQEPFLWTPTGHPHLAIDIVMTARAGPSIPIETTNNVTADDARVTFAGTNPTSGSAQSLAPTVQLGGEATNGLAVGYGAGCAGTNGTPSCTTVGLPQLPNPDFGIRVRNAAGNTPAFLLVGFGSASLPLGGAPGCTVLNGLEIGTFGFAITSPAGDGSLPLPLANDPGFDGFAFRTQWVVFDPPANALGLTTSDGQLLTMRFF